jgi:DNA binding domain, excisionase family
MAMPEKSNLFYSVSQVSEALGVTRVSVARWIAKGTIPSIRLGGRRLIAKSFIDDLIAKASVRSEGAK